MVLSNILLCGMNVKERLIMVILSYEKFFFLSESFFLILLIYDCYEISYCLFFFIIIVMSFEMFCL